MKDEEIIDHNGSMNKEKDWEKEYWQVHADIHKRIIVLLLLTIIKFKTVEPLIIRTA